MSRFALSQCWGEQSRRRLKRSLMVGSCPYSTTVFSSPFSMQAAAMRAPASAPYRRENQSVNPSSCVMSTRMRPRTEGLAAANPFAARTHAVGHEQ